jgi:hypothetical protein
MASADARVVTNATACVVGDDVFKFVINRIWNSNCLQEILIVGLENKIRENFLLTPTVKVGV